jgi:hypothetical protein
MDVMLKVSVEQLMKVPMLVSESTCSGKTYVVTGSNTGLGLETARHLVEFAASRVILAVRNLTAGEKAKKDIEKSTGRQGAVEVSMRVQFGNTPIPLEKLISIIGLAPRHGILHIYSELRKESVGGTG